MDIFFNRPIVLPMSITANSLKALLAGAVMACVLGLQAIAQTPVTNASKISRAGFGHAVVFSYGRIDEDNAYAASLPYESFQSHITALQDGGYNVASAKEIAETLKASETLPDRTIGITFDGAYSSAKKAMDYLIDQDIPFTVFIAPEQIESGSPQYLNWSEIKTLRGNKLVTIGLSSGGAENAATDTEFRRRINRARVLYRENLNAEPALFAFSGGVITSDHRAAITQQGFLAAFGLQSGVVHTASDWQALPRFMMSGDYGSLERFLTAASALPLPVQDFEPADNVIDPQSPVIGFTLPADMGSIAQRLSCFVSGQGAATIERLGSRLEIRPKYPLDESRVRINCTASETNTAEGEDAPRWRWLGMLLKVGNAPATEDESLAIEPLEESRLVKTAPAVLP